MFCIGTTQTTQITQTTQTVQVEEENIENSLIQMIEKYPEYSQAEYAEDLQCGKDLVKYYLKKLKDSRKIERIGTSHRGYWKIKR